MLKQTRGNLVTLGHEYLRKALRRDYVFVDVWDTETSSGAGTA